MTVQENTWSQPWAGKLSWYLSPFSKAGEGGDGREFQRGVGRNSTQLQPAGTVKENTNKGPSKNMTLIHFARLVKE